jgi:repressor LexA
MELYSPTVREIARAMSIKSPNGVVVHLEALEKKGWIRRRPNSSRGIEVTP